MSTTNSVPGAPLSGPCAAPRDEVETRCAEAERLGQAAVAHEQRLREVKRQLMQVGALRDADMRVRDRRQLNAAKDAARVSYRASMGHARDQGDVHEAARVWLRDIDRLNRQVAVADKRAEDVVRRATELERSLPGIELAADAARISAEAARDACLQARRALADCEEEAQRRIHSGATAASVPNVVRPRLKTLGQAPVASAPPGLSRSAARPISLVLRGDRETLLALALRLAEETGVEAGRLQLLLLELRESIAARALEDNALRFPANHPFWSQFSAEISRQVVASLASMGYRYDGRDSWVDSRAPTIRELAMALSHIGLDPRALRRPVGQDALDGLWQGTTVVVEEYLAGRAPNLDLQQVMACLGPRGARLGELWDMWGRLRPLLLTPA
jgi:hypothetical protein